MNEKNEHPVFVIVRTGFASDTGPLYQIALRQGDWTAVWYDTDGTPGPNDPVQLGKARQRLEALNDQVKLERMGG